MYTLMTTLPDRTAELYGDGAGGAGAGAHPAPSRVGIIDPDDDSGPENVKVTPPPDDPDQPAKRRTPVYECGCQEPRRSG